MNEVDILGTTYTIRKETLKDEVMTKNQFSYLKIVNKENEKFLSFLNQAKENYFTDKETKIIML